MPISVRQDVAPEYNLGHSFGLRSTEGFSTGSYLEHVRSRIADRNYRRFHESWTLDEGLTFVGDIDRDIQKNVTKALASRFGLRDNPASDGAIFDDLWPLLWGARKYKKKVDSDIGDALAQAYEFAGIVAAGESLSDRPPTWARLTDRSDHSHYVIFSDHHMTAFRNGFSLDNYFLEVNYQLYLDVLGHYSERSGGFCLVENGDVEECVIYETTAEDARARRAARDAMPMFEERFPIRQLDVDWKPFLELRYEQRNQNLDKIFARYRDYYRVVKDRFVANDRYVRLTGNHDTYSDGHREKVLRDRIQEQLGSPGNSFPVHDILRIRQGGRVSHLVMHGHQFDAVSLQHGDVSYALSLGEVFSEAASWIYQGPDRFWTASDTKKWINGWSFQNVLAREDFLPYGALMDLAAEVEHLSGAAGPLAGEVGSRISSGLLTPGTASALDLLGAGGTGNPMRDVFIGLFSSIDNIRADPRAFVETLLGHEIAWEYFENENAFDALALEVASGDEFFKFRHLNERTLVDKYRRSFDAQNAPFPIPKLVLGHTHEPRQNAVNPDTGDSIDYYLNSGSAGRFENLIWCVELSVSPDPSEFSDRIVSWSNDRGRLKKITWRSENSTLVYDRIEHFG